MNYYNEFDPLAAAWLRELIAANLIPEGTVDERSICDVQPSDLDGFTQCHFFAGIGGWSRALQIAGWPADRPVWTGSCPCQPYSSAGKGKGNADERNLWPEMFRLIRECRPVAVFGEQVEAAVRHGWLDGISTDLEGEGYAVGAAVLGAHSVGAPHIRQRLYWVADSNINGRCEGQSATEAARHRRAVKSDGCAGGVQHATSDGREQRRAQPDGRGAERGRGASGVSESEGEQVGYARLARESADTFWTPFDILPFRDGKQRRVEPGTFPLADGLPSGVVPSCDISLAYVQATAEARVMRLKGYGNAIVPQDAAEFILAKLGIGLGEQQIRGAA